MLPQHVAVAYSPSIDVARSPLIVQVPRPAFRASPLTILDHRCRRSPVLVLRSPFRSPPTGHLTLTVHCTRAPLPHLWRRTIPTLSTAARSPPIDLPALIPPWTARRTPPFDRGPFTAQRPSPLLLSSVAHSSRLTLVAILSLAQSNELSLIFPLALHS